ncbi:carbon storage regulator (plasmid) [Bacillus licheniformis]|uniref:carbon storage regulator n=1 Tax=Bacillus TaxID=1386 RepID=UPI0009B75968|nr:MULTISPECIES: carbon storage regulator [Bacillus]ARC67337.1 carbon storage regulator [Bacillus licheniformis]MCY8577627.1 carbon storage regulator [Bacillus haynesii]MDE1421773.1 carbon storage regulator [Bacillus licheniformis]MEC0475778.1 carbon storage regulator [Bacillus licheniformis]QAS18678.1 carbon storage regulator [Bacillus licheniformis]
MALVISRQYEESFIITDSIGNEIKITVVEDKDNRNQVRLAIEAPKEFLIRRTEVSSDKDVEEISKTNNITRR